MANNRMYLRCPHCPEAKPLMLAKYYPATGWYGWSGEGLPGATDTRSLEDRINEFFEAHRHDSQWGNEFQLEFEMEPDFAVVGH